MKNQIYIHKCPKCGREVLYRTKSAFDKAENEQSFCRNCRELEKGLAANYTRKCPVCGKEIKYKRKGDYNWAIKNNTKCINCCENSGRFKSKIRNFEKLNNSINKLEIFNKTTIPMSNLDKLLEESLESFYWLGFIIADGSFYKYRFELGLKESDLSHLEKFKDFLQSNSKIVYRSKTKSYRFGFNNRFSIPKVMEKYGIHYAKTYNPCTFDPFKNYSQNLLMSLFIGIIDGDGHIDKQGQYITITAHQSWIQFYKDLVSYLNIPFHIRFIKNTHNIVISCGNKEGRTILHNFIQQYNIPLLKRKWNRLKI